jgi:dual oxidase
MAAGVRILGREETLHHVPGPCCWNHGCFWCVAARDMSRRDSTAELSAGALSLKASAGCLYPTFFFLILSTAAIPHVGLLASFPTLLVVCERTWRFILGFCPISADLEVRDEETVMITANIPRTRLWAYKAGQYVFVQIPQLS